MKERGILGWARHENGGGLVSCAVGELACGSVHRRRGATTGMERSSDDLYGETRRECQLTTAANRTHAAIAIPIATFIAAATTRPMSAPVATRVAAPPA